MQIVLVEARSIIRQPERDVFGAGRVHAQSVTLSQREQLSHICKAGALGKRFELLRLERTPPLNTGVKIQD